MFRNMEEWETLLTELCRGTEYEAMKNGGTGNTEGIAIVPRGEISPQKICVYPKKTQNPGFVIEKDVYELAQDKCGLRDYDREKSKRPHFNDLDEGVIIDVCNTFLNQ